jgi:Ca-activated chloride channel family protein
MKRWFGMGLLVAAMAAGSPALAAGLIIVDEAHWWPGPIPPPRPWPPPRPIVPPRPHVFAPLEVSSVQVEARVTDQVAVTTIQQEFYNPNPTRLEGTFLFPLPKGAHLNKFTLEIDGKPAEAELLAADKARRIYEDIVRKAQDPALLEYADRDVLKLRIFPIEPRSHRRITLRYTQLLRLDAGLIGYTLPLNTEKFSAKPLKNLSVKIEIESQQPIKSIYSPTHTVEIKRAGARRATIGFEGNQVRPDSDLALYFAPEKAHLGLNLLTHRVGGEEGYFLLLVSPGIDVAREKVLAKDVVLVLDTSGSMAGKKLDQARKALLFCVASLNPDDRFEIIRFSTEVEPLFDGFVPADSKNRARAERFVEGLKAMGGTAIHDALVKALSVAAGAEKGGRPQVIIFLTDGRPTIGVTGESQILESIGKENRGKTRVFSFGIGTDVNTHLLDRLSEMTRASTQYVLPEEDLEVKVSSFFAKISEPVLADPVLRFTGNVRVSKLYPSPLPDLFKGEQLVLVGRYSGSGDAAVELEGRVNDAVKTYTYEGTFAEKSDDHDFIPRLWATRRVGYLLDEIRLHGEEAELREEATELARKYGIVTPYTAYLIVEDEARRNVPESVRSMPRFFLDGEARQQAAASYDAFRSERGGLSGLAGARYGMALKSADAPAAAAQDSMMESARALGVPGVAARLPGSSLADPADTSTAGRVLQYSQEARFVAGKTFFQTRDGWLDSAVQKHPTARRVRVEFGSADYFNLARQHPEALPWLALGTDVQFVLGDAVYEVRTPEAR